VKDGDLDVLADLGAGNGGTVTKVWNKKRKCVMARKVSLGRLLPLICFMFRVPSQEMHLDMSRFSGAR